MAHALADLGEARIEAIVHDTGLANGIAAVAAINRYYNRDKILIGAYKGHVGAPELPEPTGPEPMMDDWEDPDQPEPPSPPAGPKPFWTNDGRGVYVKALSRGLGHATRQPCSCVCGPPRATG